MVISMKKKPAVSAARRRYRDLPIIGWREWLAIPTLGIAGIKAKIDTGARSSSIHALHIRTLTERGAPHVSFMVYPEQRRRSPAIECLAEIRDERVVKSSTGHEQRRYVIQATGCLGGLIWPIELTLANRAPMGFRMLLGREAIRGRFLVDPDHSFLAGAPAPDIEGDPPEELGRNREKALPQRAKVKSRQKGIK